MKTLSLKHSSVSVWIPLKALLMLQQDIQHALALMANFKLMEFAYQKLKLLQLPRL
jgi:hypothetical protein